ncbi:MAG: hypothetical protein WCR52_11290 [Bacteroidota bacterium]
MKSYLYCSAVGWLMGVSLPILPAQTEADSATETPTPITKPVATSETNNGDTSKYWLFRHARVTGGQITLPFKIRKSRENHTFRLTTDVTLGGYVGYTRRLSTKKKYSLTIPFTAGLTFINITDNNTSLRVEAETADVVPGLTWSSGIILQLESYNLGIMFGKDYASNVGDQWAYHGKLWWSFGVGFVFLK